MAKPSAKQVNIPDWNYSCTSCGECCRTLYVYLTEEDHEKLNRMKWDPEDEIPDKRLQKINGDYYIAHHPDGGCVYLDRETELCKIHGKFGYEEKPLGCKIYPYSIVTTFENEYSVIGRFDCSAVRDKDGDPMRQAMGDARNYIDEMNLQGGFDERILDGLNRNTIDMIIRSLFKYIFNNRKLSPEDQCILLLMAIDRFERLGTTFLNDQKTLSDIIPSLYVRLAQDATLIYKRKLGRVEQWRFLSLLTAFLRRDEEVVSKGGLSRIKRVTEMSKIYFGKINLNKLGQGHPDYPLKGGTLFKEAIVNPQEMPFDLCVDLIKIRLQSYQFMGKSHYNLGFFKGIKFLFVSMTLIMALAKWSALARDPENCEITEKDMDYAVGAIDHSLGRSALLSTHVVHSFMKQISDPFVNAQLIKNIISGKRAE